MKWNIVAVGVAVLMVVSNSVQAENRAFWSATIEKLTFDARTGTCAVWVSPGPADRGLAACDNRWVSFDCAGDFGSKSDGTAAFSVAQLAFVTGRPLSIQVTDARRVAINSTVEYCSALQVQVDP